MNPKALRSTPPSRLLDAAETPDEVATAALLAELPTAAPDDLAVERVWRRVAAPAVSPSRRPLLVWVPAVVAFAAVLLFVLVGRPSKAELALSSGGVFSAKLTDEWRASRSGEAMVEDDRIRTDATGRAVLRIDGVAAVLVREDTDLGLERLRHGTILRLSRGTVTARVSKRSPDEPFVIETDRYRVRVVGTLFTVEQGPGDHTVVSVREGIVDVSPLSGPGRIDRVLAGQRWVSDSVTTRTLDATPDAVKTLLEAGLAGGSAADLAGPFIAVVTPPGASHPVAPAPAGAKTAPTWAGGSPAAEERHAPEVPSAVAHAPPRNEAVARAEGPIAHPEDRFAPVPPPEDAAPVPVPVPSAIPVPEPSASAPTVAVVQAADEGPYARGRALEARGDYAGAAAAFKRASEEDVVHGDLAIYALGRVAQRHLHDPVRARQAFDAYRARYPHGALLPEVDLAILELEVDAHADTDALDGSARFLAAHPTSERVDEVRLLRGNLLRDGDRCAEALSDYAKVHAAPFSDHALYSTAYCQRKLGDRLAAAATLRAYLVRFPNGAHRAEAQQALTDE